MYILITWKNSGTILFSLIKWENVLSKNMLTRFRCTCSAPHFWHVHSIYLDFKFIYKFNNTENVLQMCSSMLDATQTLRVLHILGTGFLLIITNLSFCWKIQPHLTRSCTLIQVFLQIRQIHQFLGLTDIWQT